MSREKGTFITIALQCAFRKAQESDEILKLDDALQLPVYTDGANLLDENINTTKESTEAILEINKETGLKLKAKLNCTGAKYADWPKNQLIG
jgi:hypothetical protein